MSRELFATRLGTVEARWTNGAVSSLQLLPDQRGDSPVSSLARRVASHLQGECHDFLDVETHYPNSTEFACAVYDQLRKVQPGRTVTYGELAAEMGKPRAAQAVGNALGKNPILIVVPCHRVIGKGKNRGGFSAPGGLDTKELLLAAEGVGTVSLWEPGELEKGYNHLLGCPQLGPVVKKVGPCPLRPLYPDSPFGALARAIIYQQLATPAAQAIEARVKQLGSDPFPTAEELQSLPETSLRNAGLSGTKVATLKRLSQATLQGDLEPGILRLLPNRLVEERVSSLKGLGPWTAQMFLLFHLGRRNILPTGDLGIRRGFEKVFNLNRRPSVRFMESRARSWQPYRSLASWYLWRSLEVEI